MEDLTLNLNVLQETKQLELQQEVVDQISAVENILRTGLYKN